MGRDVVQVLGLATSWESNEAGDEVTFELRDDVVFHDVGSFNSETVKFRLRKT